MAKILPLVMVAGAAVFLTAFDLETSVTLRPDLSCTAEVASSVDMERMAEYLGDIPRRLGHQELSPREVHQGALAAVAKLAATRQEDLARSRAQLERSLPAGVKVTAMTDDLHGTVSTSSLRLDCADVRKLWQVVLPEGRNPFRFGPPAAPGQPTQPAPGPGAGQLAQPKATPASPTDAGVPPASGPAAQNEPSDPRTEPYRDFTDRPLYGLVVTELSDSVQVILTFSNPVVLTRTVIGNLPTSPSIAVVDRLYAGSRFIFKLDSPFEVISTNATRREGRKLIWEIPVSDPSAPLSQILIAHLKK
ncbi:MAG: hypothetical protein JOZ15_08465 [Acidobacteria bacterium]|nr:hypothetical protein [Acidobacteriota bacterium]